MSRAMPTFPAEFPDKDKVLGWLPGVSPSLRLSSRARQDLYNRSRDVILANLSVTLGRRTAYESRASRPTE